MMEAIKYSGTASAVWTAQLAAGRTGHGMCHITAMNCVIAVLKTYSSSGRPMTVKQIHMACGGLVSKKQILSCLKEYLTLQEECKRDMFSYHNRGTLIRIGKERGIRYYWKDLMSREACEISKALHQSPSVRR